MVRNLRQHHRGQDEMLLSAVAGIGDLTLSVMTLFSVLVTMFLIPTERAHTSCHRNIQRCPRVVFDRG